MPAARLTPRRTPRVALLGVAAAVALLLGDTGSAVATCGSTSIAAGSGVAGDPYQVTSRADLQQIGASAANMACEYRLMNDIALGGIGAPWTPLGPGSPTTKFTGKLLGNNKTISGLAFSTGGDTVGLFRELGGATVSDLTLSGVNITADHQLGAIAGMVSTGTNTLSGVVVSGTVTASIATPSYADAGGFVGTVAAGATLNIASASATTTVSGTQACVGGMVGENDGALSVTDANVVATVNGSSGTGGILGFAPSGSTTTINGVTMNVAIGPGSNAGGAVGFTYAALTVANVSGTVTVTDGAFTGGIAGRTVAGGPVSIDDIDLDVTMTATGSGKVGGILGDSGNPALSLTDVAVSGSITSPSGTDLGGVIGSARLQPNASPAASIQRITNEGMTVTSGGASVGGIVGSVNGGQTTAQIRDLKVQGGTVQGSWRVGGIIGYWQNGGIMFQGQASSLSKLVSHATTSATGTDAGGLIGRLEHYTFAVTVTDSYADRNVTATGGSAGGLIGTVASSQTSAPLALTNVYSASAVSGSSKGAFLGTDNRSETVGVWVFTGSFWSTMLSGTSSARAGSANAYGSIEQTPGQMASIAPYAAASWSIGTGWQPVATRTATWGICLLANSGRPFLMVEHVTDPCLLAPANPVATPGDARATVTVDAQPDTAVAVTNYEYQLNGGPWTAQSPASGGTTITIPGLANGTTYSARVRAVGPNGPGDVGPASAAVTVTPAAPVIPAPDAGASPAGAQTSAPSSGSPARAFGRLTVVSPPTEAWIEARGADVAPAPDALRTRVRVTGPGTVRQQATATGAAELSRAAGSARWSVCSDTTPVRVAGVVTITCPLSTRARAALRTRALRTRVTTTFIGADGTRSRAVRTVTLARVLPRAARTAVAG